MYSILIGYLDGHRFIVLAFALFLPILRAINLILYHVLYITPFVSTIHIVMPTPVEMKPHEQKFALLFININH